MIDSKLFFICVSRTLEDLFFFRFVRGWRRCDFRVLSVGFILVLREIELIVEKRRNILVCFIFLFLLSL